MQLSEKPIDFLNPIRDKACISMIMVKPGRPKYIDDHSATLAAAILLL